MKTRTSIVLLSAVSLLCVLLVAMASRTTAQTEQQLATPTLSPTPSLSFSHVIVESAFLRSGPGVNYVPMGALNAGNRLAPLNRSADGEWVLVTYFRNTAGWIRRDLGFWLEDIDSLPVRETDNLTPTFMVGRETGTPFYYPTATPSGNFVLTSDEFAFVRTGPGLFYDAIGYLSPGALVVPVGRNEDITWVLIRVTFPAVGEYTPGEVGFAWVAQDLIFWSDDLETLPILTEDNLTPTLTETHTSTPTFTHTPSATFTASATPLLTATFTPSVTASHTSTPTRTPTLTETPSSTPTDTPVPTATATATATLTATATHTPVPPSVTPLPTPTHTATSTDTATAAPSETPVPSVTDTATATLTTTPSPEDSPFPTEVVAIIVESATLTREVPTRAPTSTPLPTATETSEPAAAIVPTTTAPTVQGPTSTNPATDPPDEDSQGLRIETIVGGFVVVAVVAYIGIYLAGVGDVERYRNGFVIDKCPVCQKGAMHVELRQTRVMGVPRPKRTVRCDVCRSVLREVGHRRWRYAVDPLGNPAMYERFNSREIDEQTLIQLSNEPIHPHAAKSGPVTPPSFVDGEDEGE